MLRKCLLEHIIEGKTEKKTAVFVVGPAGWPDHEHSTAITTIRR
jgi:hypothetical protein